MHTLSEPCPYCAGAGRVLSKETMATKVERWFARARADKKYTAFHLVVNPMVAEAMSDNGINRVDRIMKMHRFRINLVRDTTLQVNEYKIYDSETTEEISDKYKA